MLLKYLTLLNQKQIVLASKSPRRSELLKLIGLKNFKIIPSNFEENLNPSTFETPVEYVIETAKNKVQEVVSRISTKDIDLVIGADTVVELEGKVLEKPQDKSDAHRMLLNLSGKKHEVHTGMILMVPKNEIASEWICKTSSCTSCVWFDNIDSDDIIAYIETGEPMDKAGAYGIQGFGGAFVKKVEGCYFNVMGLPMNKLSVEIRKFVEEGLLK